MFANAYCVMYSSATAAGENTTYGMYIESRKDLRRVVPFVDRIARDIPEDVSEVRNRNWSN